MLQVEGGNMLQGVTEVRGREHSICSLSALDQGEPCHQKCCCALPSVAAFRQQHIYWLFIGCEHSEQWLCGQGPGVQLSVAHGSAEFGRALLLNKPRKGGTAE